MKYLAIDVGRKRTGLAVCDPSETITSPLVVITGRDVIEQIVRAVMENEIDAVVVGLPLNMDGSEGPQAKAVREFASQLRERLDIPMHFQDERLTSFSADDKLAVADFTRKKKRKRQDAIAAAEILAAFLEAKDSGNGEQGGCP